MLCKNCMIVMSMGTAYEQTKNGGSSAKRFHECKKCHDKIYTKEPNFQECLNRVSKKRKNR